MNCISCLAVLKCGSHLSIDHVVWLGDNFNVGVHMCAKFHDNTQYL